MRLNHDKMEIAMARKGMNQKALSQAAGVCQQTISAVIWGKGASPATVRKISEALGVDPAEIAEREGV